MVYEIDQTIKIQIQCTARSKTLTHIRRPKLLFVLFNNGKNTTLTNSGNPKIPSLRCLQFRDSGLVKTTGIPRLGILG